ncbi:MAG: hypothetical protein ACJ74O_13725 [Frankiaceae bacterium]|jgi:hypothetical protein
MHLNPWAIAALALLVALPPMAVLTGRVLMSNRKRLDRAVQRRAA